MFIGPIEAISTFVNQGSVPKTKGNGKSSSKGNSRKVAPVKESGKTKDSKEKSGSSIDIKG